MAQLRRHNGCVGERPVSISFTRSYPGARARSEKKSRDNTWASLHGGELWGEIDTRKPRNVRVAQFSRGWFRRRGRGRLVVGSWNSIRQFLGRGTSCSSVRILSRTSVFNAFHCVYVARVMRPLVILTSSSPLFEHGLRRWGEKKSKKGARKW